MEQTDGSGMSDCLGAAGGVQLTEYLVVVPFDGTRGEDELIGNFAVGEAVRNEVEDFEFAFGEGDGEVARR